MLTSAQSAQLVVELADVRIIALGVLNKPRGSTSVNANARLLLHPPGIEKDGADGSPASPVAPEDASGRHEHKTPRLRFGTSKSFLY